MSVKDVESNHPDYQRLKREADLVTIMMDEHELKRVCRADEGGENSYLKKPISYSRPDKPEKEKALYDEYVEHAFLPEHIVSDASEEMIGICFKVKPIINLPDKIKHLEKHANLKGDSLRALAEDVLRDVIATRRATVSTDFLEDRSVITHGKSMAMVNWRKNSSGYVMIVLSESAEEGEQRRHYSVESGELVVTTYRKDDSGEWVEHIEVDDEGMAVPQPSLPNNEPYDYIPLRVVETVKPALLGMARTVWKGFKLSAAHFGTLHKLTPTLVIKSDKNAQALSVGYENGLLIGQGDSAELLQPGVDGTTPLEKAMNGMFNSAIDQGVRLVSESTKVESGEALFLKNANKQIKVDSVARVVSSEIEEALRVAAILENANPDEVEFKLQVVLVEDPVDVEQLKEMREAVVDGQLVKWSDYLIQMQKNNLVVLDKNDDGTYDTEKYITEATAEFKELNAEAEVI